MEGTPMTNEEYIEARRIGREITALRKRFDAIGFTDAAMHLTMTIVSIECEIYLRSTVVEIVDGTPARHLQ
jgi:hypothetical protein